MKHFLLAVGLAVGSVAYAHAAAAAAAPAAEGLEEAIPYLHAFAWSAHFARVEGESEGDPGACVDYIYETLDWVAQAQVQICGSPLCTGDWAAPAVAGLPEALDYLRLCEHSAALAVGEAEVSGDLDETLNYINEATNACIEAMVRIQGWPNPGAPSE